MTTGFYMRATLAFNGLNTPVSTSYSGCPISTSPSAHSCLEMSAEELATAIICSKHL